jgi:hypothetical protein
MAGEVTTVSAERIGAEVRRMLLDQNRGFALELLRESQLLPHVLPEVASLGAEDYAETERRLMNLRTPTFPLTLAALLSCARNAAASGKTHAAPSPLLLAHSLGRRLRFTKKEIERADWLLDQGHNIAEAGSLPWPKLQRLLVHDGAAELIALREAIAGSGDPAVLFCRERLAWPPERLNPPPLIDGAALIAHGLAPGPQFAPILEEVRDAQLMGQVNTRAEALALVDQLR